MCHLKMIIPESILETLICSECKKYLSVSPVKVYPNRLVKCGRCAKEDDGGTISILFNEVVKSMKFPCENRLDGCREMGCITEMTAHEKICIGWNYICHFCPAFEGPAFELNMHCRTHHGKKVLQNKEFCIDLSNGAPNSYLYSGESQLLFIRYGCDVEQRNLTVSVAFYGHCLKGKILYSLRFYSVENELLCKTEKQPCFLVLTGLYAPSTSVDLKSIKVPGNIIVCKLFTYEEPLMICNGKFLSLIDESEDSCIMKLSFKMPDRLECIDNTEIFHPAVYIVKNIPWRVFVKRRRSLTDYKKKIGIYLEWYISEEDSSEDECVRSCKVSALFSIVRSDGCKISKNFQGRKIIAGDSVGVYLHDWYFIISEENGYLHDNRIDIEVKMKVLSNEKDVVRCYNCHRTCRYCNNN